MANSLEFYGGEDRVLSVRLSVRDSEGILRPFAIPSGSTVTFTLPASPAELSKSGVIDNNDQGLCHVDLDDTDTTSMKSGDLIVTIQSGSITRISKLRNAIIKLKL